MPLQDIVTGDLLEPNSCTKLSVTFLGKIAASTFGVLVLDFLSVFPVYLHI